MHPESIKNRGAFFVGKLCIDNINAIWYNFCVNIYIKELIYMSRIKTLETKDLKKSVENGGCGECQTSCQSACKTSCGVANQQCEKSNK